MRTESLRSGARPGRWRSYVNRSHALTSLWLTFMVNGEPRHWKWNSIMPYSHHSHSGQFCKHAVGSLEEVVLEAIRQGFEVYGLTEHVPRYRDEDLYPEEASIFFLILFVMSWYPYFLWQRGHSELVLRMQFEAFCRKHIVLKSLYASKIPLLVGLETEFITSVDLEHLLESTHKAWWSSRVPRQFRPSRQRHPHRFRSANLWKSPPQYVVRADSASVELLGMEMFLSTYFDAQYELLSHFQTRDY